MRRGGSWADTLVAGVTIKPSSVRFRTITRHNNYHIISTSNLDIDPVGLHLTGDVAEEKSGMELELGRGGGEVGEAWREACDGDIQYSCLHANQYEEAIYSCNL